MPLDCAAKPRTHRIVSFHGHRYTYISCWNEVRRIKCDPWWTRRASGVTPRLRSATRASAVDCQWLATPQGLETTDPSPNKNDTYDLGGTRNALARVVLRLSIKKRNTKQKKQENNKENNNNKKDNNKTRKIGERLENTVPEEAKKKELPERPPAPPGPRRAHYKVMYYCMK